MKIDTSIVDTYLEEKSDINIKNHWIFNNIIEGKYLYEKPQIEEIDKYREIKEILINALTDFKPNNYIQWEEVYGKLNGISNDYSVMIIIGASEPYDAFVRCVNDEKIVMVFDVKRMINYYDRIEEVVRNLVTHEVSHIITHRIHDLYSRKISNKEKLKQILFDEGFAHFVACAHLYQKNSMDDNEKHRTNAYERLHNVLKHEITDGILEEGNSGSFWNKYISISGYYVIFDYISDGGSARDLFNQGYEYFYNYWIAKFEGGKE